MRAGPALALLLVLLPLAGCIGTEDDPPADVTPANVSPSTQDEPATPGGPTPTEPSPGSNEPNHVDVAGPTPTTTPLSWDGALKTGACAPTLPGSCFGVFALNEPRWTVLEAPGNVTHVSATVTWTPSSPLTEKLTVTLVRAVSCGDDCWKGDRIGDTVVGTSGIALDLDVPTLTPDEMLILDVRQANLAPEPLFAFGRLEQPFHVEGEIASLA